MLHTIRNMSSRDISIRTINDFGEEDCYILRPGVAIKGVTKEAINMIRAGFVHNLIDGLTVFSFLKIEEEEKPKIAWQTEGF